MNLTLPVDVGTLLVFLLVLARTTAWAVTAPLVGTRGIAPIARLAFGVALALFFTPLAAHGPIPEGVVPFVTMAAAQTALGLALGYLTGLLLTAVEAAGALVDFSSGFSMGALLDPVSGAQSAAFARLANLSFMALLFATDGYQSVVRGFGRSFLSLPVDHFPSLAAGGASVIARTMAQQLLAAFEIGAPLLGVLFLTEAVIALASRLAPAANPLAYSMSIKALVALLCGGILIASLPSHISGILEPALRLGGQVIR